MRDALRLLSLLFLLITFVIPAHAQFDGIFSPFDCREHAELFHDEPVEELVLDEQALLQVEVATPTEVSIANWQQWNYVENFAFGKDRGNMPMITDLSALHPYFRDQIKTLIAVCHEKGIELAVVESYRTHAKQNEYKGMGKKYTNSGAGRSKHQYGLAVDVVPMVNAVAVWDNKELWKKVGVEGEKLGLRWGGRWRSPYDPGHFEWTGGLTSLHLGKGQWPAIPNAGDNYPCLEEDITLLRQYWDAWEVYQGAIVRK
jgi:hypothetical protein